MREKFSNGFSSSVYLVSEKEKTQYATADLVREDSEADRTWFARLYYQHKIAKLLFPDNFINVVGSTNGVDDANNTASKLNVKLYSEIANINNEHATFSKHMTLIPDKDQLSKGSKCRCDECISHKEFHKNNDLDKRAKQTAIKIAKTGITPAWDDASDFCLNETNNQILYFEFNNFNEDRLYKYFAQIKDKNLNEAKASNLLNRYNLLLEKSRDDIRKGISLSIRFN